MSIVAGEPCLNVDGSLVGMDLADPRPLEMLFPKLRRDTVWKWSSCGDVITHHHLQIFRPFPHQLSTPRTTKTSKTNSEPPREQRYTRQTENQKLTHAYFGDRTILWSLEPPPVPYIIYPFRQIPPEDILTNSNICILKVKGQRHPIIFTHIQTSHTPQSHKSAYTTCTPPLTQT